MHAIRTTTTFLLITMLLIFGMVAQGCGGEGAAAEVSVQTRGEGSMHVLRLKPTRGSIQRSTMTIKMSVDQQLSDGSSQSPPIPELSITTETIIDAVHADGRIDCSFEVVDAQALRTASVDEFVRSEVQRALDDMVGTTGTLSLNSRGVVLSSHVDIPSYADAATRKMLDGLEEEMAVMSIYFPEEAVGVGAIWIVEETVKLNGLKQTITTTYTIKSIEGDMVTLAVDFHSRGDSQEIEMPELPPNATIELEDHEAFGWGTISMDLRWLDPIEATVRIDAQQELTVRYAGQTMRIDQQPRARMSTRTVQTTPDRLTLATP